MLRRFSDQELLGKPLTDHQKRELLALMDIHDEDVDTSDIPEVETLPPGAVRGEWTSAVYLNCDLQRYPAAAAERKGISLNDLVNDLLGKEIAIVEALK
jgi:hypothetical protein